MDPFPKEIIFAGLDGTFTWRNPCCPGAAEFLNMSAAGRVLPVFDQQFFPRGRDAGLGRKCIGLGVRQCRRSFYRRGGHHPLPAGLCAVPKTYTTGGNRVVRAVSWPRRASPCGIAPTEDVTAVLVSYDPP